MEIRLHVHNHELNERVAGAPSSWLQHRVQHNPSLLALVGEGEACLRRDLRQEFLELLELARWIVDLSERAQAVFAEEPDCLLKGKKGASYRGSWHRGDRQVACK